MADVRVKHKVTGEIIEMSEYSFNLNRDDYELVGANAPANKRPIIADEPSETLGSEKIPSVLDAPKPKGRTKK